VAAPNAIGQRVALVDVVTGLLDKGTVISGEATVSLAGVDLVHIALNLLVSSVETMRAGGVTPRPAAPVAPLLPTRVAGGGAAVRGPSGSAGLEPAPELILPRGGQLLTAEPTAPTASPAEQNDQGLAGLVLALVELIRQLLERQAVRRMEGGALTEDEVERMGRALMELNAKMRELFAIFGLEEADVNLDLGPLGQLL
jgi:hypothetical protein